jgi:dihydrofolate reductase
MERKVVLFIAMSIDGYIADTNGGVDWLIGEDSNYTGYTEYDEFIKTIDTVILGMSTYKQIKTKLSPELWPYAGMKSYVLTHSKHENTDEIKFVQEDITSLVTKLKRESKKNIWICGGADIVNQFVKLDAIDEYHLTTIPIILGKGIRLFGNSNHEIKLHLESCTQENGMIDSVYHRR